MVLLLLVMLRLLLLVAIVGADLGHLAGLPLDLHEGVRRVGLLVVVVVLQRCSRSVAPELVQLQVVRRMGPWLLHWHCNGSRLRGRRGHQERGRGRGGSQSRAQDIGGTAAGAGIERGHWL